MNPQYEAHERLCKSIGDMAKENEVLKAKIARISALGDTLYALLDSPSPCMRTTECDNALQAWDDEKGNP